MTLDSDTAKYQLHRATLCGILDFSWGHMNIYSSECVWKQKEEIGIKYFTYIYISPLKGASVFLSWFDRARGPKPTDCWGFEMAITHTTLGRNPLDERSARCRYLYMKTDNIVNRQKNMPLAGLELAIPASEWPQAHVLDRATTEIGLKGYVRESNKL